jgi:hypothetical protein
MALRTRTEREPKVDTKPEAYRAKVDIRTRVLAELGADKAAILDLYAGSGKMHKAVWCAARSYVGADERFFFDRRSAYVCDNRILLRCLDLAPFNLFDLDAYGAPYDQALIIAARRQVLPGERIGIVLTDAAKINMNYGRIPLAMAMLAEAPTKAEGISSKRNELLSRAIAGLAKKMASRVVKRWEAHYRMAAYIGLVLEGIVAGVDP